MTTFHSEENWLTWIDELSDRNYVVIDDFLSESNYQDIKRFFLDKLDSFEQAGIGAKDQNQIVKGIRGDRTYWLDADRDQKLSDFWGLLEETMFVLNRYCYLSLSGHEFHLAHYPPGGYYQRHLDQLKDRNNRMISVVIYLNENWQKGDGGELEIEDGNGDLHLVEPIARRCAMFKSAEVPHAVLEANKSRYSLTGWLLYRSGAM